MSRTWAIAAAVMSAALLSHGGDEVLTTPQQPTFRSNVDLVTVDVSVRTGNRAVTGLTAADFEILDNGVAQEIGDLSYEKLPIDVTVGLDVSQSVNGVLLDQLRTSVLQLAADLTRQDRLKLITFNQRIERVIDFTANVPAVMAAVKQVNAAGGTSLVDAIAVALVSASDTARRQFVVMFSDGSDGHSISDGPVVADVARRGIATLNLVRSMPKRQTADSDGVPIRQPAESVSTTKEQEFYATLTADTGGLVVPVEAPGGDVSAIFRRLLSEFRSCYVLRFTPRGVDRGGYHTLAVRVKRPGRLDVRARRGYFGG